VLAILLLAPRLLPQDTLLIYDGQEGKSEAFKSARYLVNLLDHFTLGQRTLLPVAAYKPGLAKSAGYVFVVFEEGHAPEMGSLIQDLLETRATIVWVYMHIERLLDKSAGKWGIWHETWLERTDWKIFYKGEDFAKEDPNLNVIGRKADAPVQVLANAQDGQGQIYPYVLRSGNFWYFADSPFSFALEGGRFLILADLLHDILGQDHASSRKALLRIEDVTPEDDPSHIKEITDFLSGRKIPFQISLIPIFKDPDEQAEVYLSDRPALAGALRRAVSRGGAIVLHGATHQHRGISGDDYEFWDDIAGVPIPHESPDWVDQRVRLALKECFRNGLYPLAWETPHYSASQSDYATIARYFDTFNDRVMAAELSGTQQIFPYPVKLRSLGLAVVPENLGFLAMDKPAPDVLLENAKNMRVVRDGMASFFFHSFLPSKYLKTLVQGMSSQGWEFISLKDFPCNLRTGSQWVTSAGGPGRITATNQYVHRLLLNRSGKLEREEYSQNRVKGIVEEIRSLSRGELYVLEALDVLPENKKPSIFRRGAAFFSSLFGRKEKQKLLRLSRSLVLMNRKASRQEAFDQESFQSVLRIFGFNPQVWDIDQAAGLSFDAFDLIIVPFASAQELGEEEISLLLGFVEKGGSLVTDGRTGLAERLGLRFLEGGLSVSEVKELSLPAPLLRWNPAETVFSCNAPEAVVLAKDAHSDTSLALSFRLGRGQVLFLGALFDPFTPYGISRFPYFAFYLKNALGLPFNVRRNNLEFYFDPGFHQATSWEKLARRWRASGVRIIYLAAWHFYRDYEFDYRYFIDLCHRNGIAVYAWFELPQVSPVFWEDHPHWREKTATGKDALCHWRYQMNLVNPAARTAVAAFFRKILTSYDWDGLNLAELNYDTNKGASDPDKFTPMNADVRREFREKEHFDPAELFRPGSSFFWRTNKEAFTRFLKYRTDLTRDLHVFFLKEVESIKHTTGRELEVIVTAMDSLLHPEVVEECGVDTRDILGLMMDFPFTLQVEDPSRSWVELPSRYLAYFNAYRPYIPDPQRLMFDINGIAQRDVSSKHLPSALLTGTELATTLYYATFPSGRAAIYSENTIHSFDLDILPFVMGSDVEIREAGNGYEIRAKEPFFLIMREAGIVPIVNGREWPFYDEKTVSVPSGRSILSFRKRGFLDLEVLSFKMSFDGDIRDLRRTGNAFTLNYRSPIPVSLSFSRPLARIRLDARVITPSAEGSGVVLPRGSHRLEILTESSPSRVVGVVGYFSSSAFYFAGLLSVSLLLGMYLYSKRMK